jgi:hypothetical protein
MATSSGGECKMEPALLGCIICKSSSFQGMRLSIVIVGGSVIVICLTFWIKFLDQAYVDIVEEKGIKREKDGCCVWS